MSVFWVEFPLKNKKLTISYSKHCRNDEEIRKDTGSKVYSRSDPSHST